LWINRWLSLAVLFCAAPVAPSGAERRRLSRVDTSTIIRGAIVMKRLLIAVAACALMGAPIARSQAPTDAPMAPTSTVNLSLEQQHTIKELVKDLRLPKVDGKFEISVGTIVPSAIALQPMPTQIGVKVPQVKTHRLFVTDNRIVLVNPNDQRIAGVIEEETSTGQSNRQ
jgi:hypothetical protein